MPFDRFGIKYFYPSKVGGWNWEQDDKPEKQDGVDWPDEMSFPSDGIVRMKPNGPTDFGLGRNIQGFSDSIGGCNMDFKETAARGYAYKANDARDVEIKVLIKASGIGDHGFSISACTGHHQSGGKCCQGFAYMITNELGKNPFEAMFRKEEWHVHYTDYPGPVIKHSSMNFKIDGRDKWTGLGFCRYNDPLDVKKRVIVEAWVNPDPEADLNNWIMVKRFIDEDGEGWGDACDDCGGVKDAAGTWSNAQNRLKTNAESGWVDFKCVTLREIDPAGDFSNQPNPPPSGGPTVTRKIYYGAVSSGTTTGAASYVGYGRTTSHEIVEAQTDPDVGSGWWDDATGFEISDDNPTPQQMQYPSGLWVDWYWSNSDKNSVIPGLSEVDKGSSTRMTKHSGSGSASTITRKIVYAPAGFDHDAGEFDVNNTYMPTQILIHEMMNSIVDPDWAGRFSPGAWFDPATGDDFMDFCGITMRQYGTGVNSYQVPGYWSNSDNSCVIPHYIENDLGSSTKMKNPAGGTPFKNAKIYLVFWGTGWRDRTADPTVAGIVDRIQNRLLGTDNAYFAKLSQYDGIQTPTWGGYAVNATFAVPSGHDIPESAAKSMLINTFEKGLLSPPGNPNQNVYLIIPPHNTRIQHGSSGVPPNGYHDIMNATLTIPSSTGRLLPTPQVFLIFWGTAWRDRTSDPTMAHIVNDIQNNLLNTNKIYFSKLSQYGCGIPTWGGSCVNVTTPIPDPTEKVSVTQIQQVVTDTFNQGLLAIPGDDEDKVYLVYVPNGTENTLVISKSIALGWHGYFKATALRTPNPTPPGGGGGTGGTGGGTGGTPSVPVKVVGSFTVQRDLNIYRTTPCAGSSGGGTSGGNSKFFSSPADHDKELSDTATWQYRTRIANKLIGKHSMLGKVLKQLDVPLKKVGSPAASPTITAVIWDSRSTVYTSPTNIDPSTLTTSYVTKSFDFSGNTHQFVNGDIVGIRYFADTPTSNSNYVVAGYEDDPGVGAIICVQLEKGVWQEKRTRDAAMDMWD